LLHAFKETYEEVKILALSNNKFGLKNWLENKINSLGKELQTVEIDFEHLEMFYKATSYNEIVSFKPTKCENCELLQDKISYLMKIVARLTLGIENLNVILGSIFFFL